MSPPEKREEESPSPGERTWTIYRVRIGRSVGQWQVADETDLVSAPSPVGTTRGETYEVVELSRLRAAEEEREIAITLGTALKAERDRLAKMLRDAGEFLRREGLSGALAREIREALASLEGGNDG